MSLSVSHSTGAARRGGYVRAGLAALAMSLAAQAHAQTPPVAPTPTDEPPRLRWELVTQGASGLGGGNGTTATASTPKLTGSDASFLFRLDLQSLLNYGTAGKVPAKLNRHLTIETGITSVGRAVTAKPDLATSSTVEALANQGATVTGTPKAAPTLTRQRAFTLGAEFNANRLARANQGGAFVELGGLVRGHFDAFLNDQRFFEKNGITYVTIGGPSAVESGFFRGEAGFRARVTQAEEEEEGNLKMVGGAMKGGNVDDLLLFEIFYQRAGAVTGVVTDPAVNTANRWTMRFVATPELPLSMDMGHTKILLGLEVSNDLRNRGKKDIRIFYGANVNLSELGALF